MKCIICNNKIKENSDKWVRLTDFNRKEIIRECYYHSRCWKDKFEVVRKRIQQSTKEMLQPAMNLLGNVMNQINKNRGESGEVIKI